MGKGKLKMITRYKLEMIEAGKYDDGEWVSYTDYCELEKELYKALKQIEELGDTICKYEGHNNQ